jgi:hypothetical protein
MVSNDLYVAHNRQEDDTDILIITTSFLLADAHTTERTFELLNQEGAFARLVGLIGRPESSDEDTLHRLLMQLLYEMSRIQKITINDLSMTLVAFNHLIH